MERLQIDIKKNLVVRQEYFPSLLYYITYAAHTWGLKVYTILGFQSRTVPRPEFGENRGSELFAQTVRNGLRKSRVRKKYQFY